MNSATRNTIIAIVVIISIALLGYFVWKERQGTVPQGAASTGSSTTEILTGTSTAATSSSPGYTITATQTTLNTPTPPNYEAPLVFTDPTLSADEETTIREEFAQTQAEIKANPTGYASWMNLSTLRIEAGDYSGAAADLNYIAQLYPTDPTVYANLADLYATYLKVPATAITDYKEAIKLDPTKEVSFYQNLAQVYISEGDTSDAKAILQQGINAQVVGYQNLQTQLSSIQ